MMSYCINKLRELIHLGTDQVSYNRDMAIKLSKEIEEIERSLRLSSAEVASLKDQNDELKRGFDTMTNLHTLSQKQVVELIHERADLTQHLAAVTDECKAWAGLVKAQEGLAAANKQLTAIADLLIDWKTGNITGNTLADKIFNVFAGTNGRPDEQL